jgi:hypothetical protein
MLCCGDDAICFLRSIFDAATGQAAVARIIRGIFSPIMIDGASAALASEHPLVAVSSC